MEEKVEREKIMYTDSFFKMTIKTKVCLFFYRIFDNISQWFIVHADHYPCNNCCNNDDYGCLRSLSLGGTCDFKEKKK